MNKTLEWIISNIIVKTFLEPLTKLLPSGLTWFCGLLLYEGANKYFWEGIKAGLSDFLGPKTPAPYDVSCLAQAILFLIFTIMWWIVFSFAYPRVKVYIVLTSFIFPVISYISFKIFETPHPRVILLICIAYLIMPVGYIFTHKVIIQKWCMKEPPEICVSPLHEMIADECKDDNSIVAADILNKIVKYRKALTCPPLAKRMRNWFYSHGTLGKKLCQELSSLTFFKNIYDWLISDKICNGLYSFHSHLFNAQFYSENKIVVPVKPGNILKVMKALMRYNFYRSSTNKFLPLFIYEILKVEIEGKCEEFYRHHTKTIATKIIQ